MAWVTLTIEVPEPQCELVESIVYQFTVGGLEIRDSKIVPMPQVRRPPPGEAMLIAYFEERTEALEAQASVKNRLPTAKLYLEDVVEQDWSLSWRSHIKSVSVGRLWVGPPWEKPTAPVDKVCLFIEPKMAFGTGDHPTTALCLQAVDDFLRTHPGASVLDVGTGTGVLAFAAARLGAGRTVGIDNDATAVQLAKECAQENGIDTVELSTKTLDHVEGQFDLVLANILANTLVELAPRIASKVKTRLVLAGVLVPQAAEVIDAYQTQGLKHEGQAVQGEWIRIDFVVPAARLAP